MTKEQLRGLADTYLQKVQQGDCPDIYTAYKQPSRNKVSTYRKICNAVDILPWHTLVVVMSHTCQAFTVGYCYLANVDGVDVATFVYRTAKNTYTLRLEEDDVETVEKLCV